MALGEQLRKARESLNLTTSQVAAATRMKVQIVEAIEAHTPLRGAAARAKAIDWLRRVGIPEPERRIGEQIIGNLDQNGYLVATLDEIAQQEGTSPERVAGVLLADPSGVGTKVPRGEAEAMLRGYDRTMALDEVVTVWPASTPMPLGVPKRPPSLLSHWYV